MSLNMRLQFWINKMMKLLHVPKRNYTDDITKGFELPGIHRMRIKNIIMFLRHQQEQVEALIQLKVTNVNDFEW